MARRRKKATSRRKGRRRMGAIGKAGMQSILGIVGGAIAAKFVTAKVLPNLDARIKSAGVIALGALVFPRIVKGELGKAIGNGMVAVGGANLVSEFIPGIGAMETIDFPVTVGEVPDNISVIAGADDVMAGDDLSVLAGMEEDEEGM